MSSMRWRRPTGSGRKVLQGAPAAQVLDRLAVFPLDGVFEDVREAPAECAARHVGDAAPAADGDDKAFVVERKRLQRLPRDLGLNVVGHRLARLQGDLVEG